jgi:SAM-dependent methyltransferase
VTHETDEYVLGTHEEELLRLGLQHQLWAAQAAAAWERAGFEPGHTLLDVGCGPGHATWDLARLVGRGGRVVGVDASARFVEHVRAQAGARGAANVEARVGDVQRLELPAGSMDGAWARWVLCFVADPEATVAGVARALRPGGVFVVHDYLHYEGIVLAPHAPGFIRVIDAVSRSWRAGGGDPDVGMRLPQIMARCGMEVREIRPVIRVARPGAPLWHWPRSFFTGHVPRLVEGGWLAEGDAEEFRQEWEEHSADPAAFLLTPPMVEVIGVRAG